MKNRLFITDRKTSTPEPITSPRPSTFAREFVGRNSLINRPLRTLRGTVRSRYVYQEMPNTIEMDDIVIQDKQMQDIATPSKTSFIDEHDVETVPKRPFVSIDLDESVTELDDAFSNELPIEEEDIPTFIQYVPRRMSRPIVDALKRYARRFGLSIKYHKYFVVLLAAFTGLIKYGIYLVKKRSAMINYFTLQHTDEQNKDEMSDTKHTDEQHKDEMSDTKHIIQGIKDFAKVVTSHVPDEEQQSKHVLNKPKPKKTELLQAINQLEQKAYENMIKKRLNFDLNFKMMIENINNPLMWGLSDVLHTSNIENIMLMVLLSKLKPQLPQSFVKYKILQLV